MARLQRRARDCRVRHDQRAKALFDGDPRDGIDVGRFKVGRDLEEHRRAGFPARQQHRIEQRGQRALVLQRAQSGRVGAGNVDREIAGERRHQLGHRRIVGHAIGRILVRADVDADHPRLARAPSQPLRRESAAAVVEAHAVDHRAVLFQPEQARLRVARLRQGRDRADLGKAEAEAEQRVGHLCILVEARRHAERIGKGQPRDMGFQRATGPRRPSGGLQPEGGERQGVGAFGIEREQQRADQRIGHGPSHRLRPPVWKSTLPNFAATRLNPRRGVTRCKPERITPIW